MFGNIGAPELLLIFLVVLLVFGAKRIPEIARGLGKGIREFKSATTEIKKELTVDDTSNRIQGPAAGTPVSHTQPASYAQPQQPAPPPAASAPDNADAAQQPS